MLGEIIVSALVGSLILLFIGMIIAIWHGEHKTTKELKERKIARRKEETRLMKEFVEIGENFFFHKYKTDWFGQAQGIIRTGHLIGVNGMVQLLERRTKEENNQSPNLLEWLEKDGPTFS